MFGSFRQQSQLSGISVKYKWSKENPASNSQLLLSLDLLNKQKNPSVKLHTLVFSFQVILMSNQINGHFAYDEKIRLSSRQLYILSSILIMVLKLID